MSPLRVDALGRDGVRTLAEALTRAAPGERIELAAGRHELWETLVISHDLSIVAAGDAIVAGAGPLLVVEGGRVVLRGLAFEMETDQGDAAALTVKGGELLVDRCRIRSTAGGIAAEGACLLGVRDTDIDRTGDTAIVYAYGARGSVEGTTIANCRTVGIMAVGGRSDPRIRNNQMQRTGMFGIQAVRGAAPVIEGNVIEDTIGSGLAFDDRDTAVTVRSNTIRGSRAHGIEIGQCRACVVEDNEIVAAQFAGISIYGGARGEVARNRISEAGGNGVQIIGGANAHLAGNHVEGSGNYGVVVAQLGSSADLEANVVSGSPILVLIDDGAAATVRDNELEASGNGVVVQGDGSTAEITGNRLRMNSPKTPAVLVKHGAGALATGNEVWGDEHLALVFLRGARLVASGNTVHVDGAPRPAGVLEILNEASLRTT